MELASLDIPRPNHRVRDVLDGARVPWGAIVVAAILRMGAGLSALALPVAAANMLEQLVVPARSDAVVFRWVALLAGALLAYLALDFLATLIGARTHQTLARDVRTRWFDRLQRAPLEHVDGSSRQNWGMLLAQDAPRIAGIVALVPTQLFFAVTVFFGAIAAMAMISVPLTALVAAGAPVALAAVWALSRLVSRYSREYFESEIDLFRHADQTFSVLPAVKAFAAEDDRLRGYEARAFGVARNGVRYEGATALLGPLSQFISFGAVIAVVLAGTVWVERLPLGTLSLFVMYGLLASGTMRSLGSAIGSWREGRVSAARYHDAAPPEVERTGGIRRESIAGELEFDAVSFAYPDRTQVFDGNSSLVIRAADTAVILGENGAGKSTFVSLLLRLREPTGGAIRLDGTNARDFDLPWYRRQFAAVHQDPALFDGSIRENLLLANPRASDADVARACEMALLDEVLEGLPRGLETRIGDGGAQLSGGQRQRVALARAFLVDAPVLVLDEATSMFDPASEQRFIEKNRDHFASRTVIWITHGTAALAVADRVVSLRDGAFRTPLRKVEAHG